MPAMLRAAMVAAAAAALLIWRVAERAPNSVGVSGPAEHSGTAGAIAVQQARPFVIARAQDGSFAPGRAMLPRFTLDLDAAISSGKEIRIRRGGNLQAAIDRADPGDVILLDPGATYVGPFYLRRKNGSGWITIRSAAPDADLPAAGERIAPSFAVRLPTLATSGANQSVIYTEPGAANWRLMALEITALPQAKSLTALLRIGDASEDDSTRAASNIVLDRLYVHGQPTTELQRCIALNAGATAIVDSYIAACSSKNYDSQAIGGWNGSGPYRIANNYLEGTGENVLFGGADPRMANLIPSDIEIVRNYIVKPIEWKRTGRVIKNSLELKNAQRVLIEGNVIDGSWAEGQSGAAFNLKSANQSGGAPWSVTRDVTIRYNRIRNVGATFAITGWDASNKPTRGRTSRITIHDNIFDNINTGEYNGSAYLLLAGNGAEDVTIEHNTMVSTGRIWMLGTMDSAPSIVRFTYRCNIAMGGQYGLKGGGTGAGIPTLTRYAPQFRWADNVIIGQRGNYPPTTKFAPSLEAVGFTSLTDGDYTLRGSSPYKRQCDDGRDPGADVTRVTRATSGVAAP